jgi:two-component system, cell cycle sensor histidine kinase and response regulator CckA
LFSKAISGMGFMAEKIEKQLKDLYNIFNLLGTDTKKNIDLIVQQTCGILEAACSLYNRLDDKEKSLLVWSEFNAPADLPRKDKPDGHICYEATIKGQSNPVILEDITNTVYAQTDPHVKKYGLKSYLGYPITVNEKAIGALCIVDTQNRKFSNEEIMIISTLAKALSLEEERKIAEENIKKSEESFKNIFNASTDGILILDKKSKAILDMNDAACKLFAYKRAEFRQLTLNDLFTADSEFSSRKIKAVYNRVIKDGRQSLEWRFRGKNGDSFWVNLDIKLARIGEQEHFIAVIRDIDREKQAQHILQESEQRYRALSEATFEALFIFENGYCIETNQAASKLFGYDHDELIGKSEMDFIAPESVKLVKKNLLRGHKESFEVIAQCKDSSTFRAELQIKRLNFDGKKVRVIAVRDITNHILTELALEESRNMIRAILDTIPVRVFWKDRDSRFLGCNVPFARDAGFNDPEELTGKNDYDMGWNNQAELYRTDDQLVMKSGVPRLDYEEPQTTPEGKTIWLKTSKIPLRNRDGIIYGILGTYEDITEQKLAAQAMRESEEKYRNLIQHSTDAIYLLYNRKFEIINDKFQNIFGLKLEETNSPQFDFMQLVAPESRSLIEERMKRMARGEQLEPEYEFTAITKEGKRLEVEASVSYIRYKDGIATQGILRDVTERKQLEDQVRHIQKIEAVGRLAGGVAHDFNNLLTVINGYCELLLHRNLSEDVYDKIEQIHQAGQRASKLTSQLLAFSRKQVIQPKLININTVIINTDKMLRRLLGEDIEIMTNLHTDISIVKVDPVQMEQIIINLAVNARDAMPSGGKLYIRSNNVNFNQDFVDKHPGSKKGKYALLNMKDTGIGMDPETQSHIFEPFFTTKGRDKGTGLGLATVYGIVKQNQGYITVDSKPGKGAEFSIFLPVFEGEQETHQPGRGYGKTLHRRGNHLTG